MIWFHIYILETTMLSKQWTEPNTAMKIAQHPTVKVIVWIFRMKMRFCYVFLSNINHFSEHLGQEEVSRGKIDFNEDKIIRIIEAVK